MEKYNKKYDHESPRRRARIIMITAALELCVLTPRFSGSSRLYCVTFVTISFSQQQKNALHRDARIFCIFSAVDFVSRLCSLSFPTFSSLYPFSRASFVSLPIIIHNTRRCIIVLLNHCTSYSSASRDTCVSCFRCSDDYVIIILK